MVVVDVVTGNNLYNSTANISGHLEVVVMTVVSI